MKRNDATERQVQAADPTSNTWLSANAGSGKTRVLTDRVARLLLSGVQPQNILCLTYTKAAASEMQNRLFRRLGEWAMKPDAELAAALTELGEDQAGFSDGLRAARQLFARAIEAPGGLRIQTIHSFCAALLRRYPLEAGVSPQFKEMDDRTARHLRGQIISELADTLAPEVMLAVSHYYSGTDFHSLMDQVAARRSEFSQVRTPAEIYKSFGLAENASEASIVSSVFLGDEKQLLSDLAKHLKNGSKTDQRAAQFISALDSTSPSIRLLAELETLFLYSANTKAPFAAKVDAFPTKDLRQSLPSDFQERLRNLMVRVETARPNRIALLAARKTTVLHDFAKAFLPLYAKRKQQRGFLDFDDLILHTRNLLSDSSVAAWVLFRLDGGIDHILVDEAQDTNPVQWHVIELLAAEFTSGEGARQVNRTLFVVGDQKQSIYSFQGADVAAFDEKKQLFQNKFQVAKQPFQSLELAHSFRSSPAILRVVDEVFSDRFPEAMGSLVSHLPFKDLSPGRVDLWPAIEPVEDETDMNWHDPVDMISSQHHHTQLAEKIAQEITGLIEDGTQIFDAKTSQPRGIHAGDFLILVQRRNTLFHEIIRACKKANLPIAGADRLRLEGEMAVRDIIALLAFLATPEDDLSLAIVLRSPLGGWSENEIFNLAQGRTGYLWQDLRAGERDDPVLLMLTDLRDQTDFLRPYELIERILTRHDGRTKLITRLGVEAQEGIDELLSQALSYERTETPSLTGFLNWVESDDIEVKRQAEGQGGRIRVMTVHGAKGLEAPIVILPDTAQIKSNERGEIFLTPDKLPIWKMPTDQADATIAAARNLNEKKAAEERLRLLYVALTRAQSWLIIAAAGAVEKEDCWYRLVSQGLQAAGAIALPNGINRYAFGEWPDNKPEVRNETTLAEITIPAWVSEKCMPDIHELQVLNPSKLGGDKSLQVDDGLPEEQDSAARGTALHLLLEHLPNFAQAEWKDVAMRLIADPALCDVVFDTAVRLINAPHLSHIFDPAAFSEVSVTAATPKGRVLGTIDRLIVTSDKVEAIDFKSNLIVPKEGDAVPEGLLRQMGAYQASLEKIYPKKSVSVSILWTATGALMPLHRNIVIDAFHRAAKS